MKWANVLKSSSDIRTWAQMHFQQPRKLYENEITQGVYENFGSYEN